MSEQKTLINLARDYALARNMYETFNEDVYLEELNNLSVEMFKKEDGIKNIYDMHTKEIDIMKERVGKINAYIKALERGQEKIKQYVLSQFQTTGLLPAQSVFQPIRVSKSAGSVVIEDASKIPFEYIRVKQIEEPDKKAISEALKNGVDVPGCILVKNEYVRGIK